MRAGAVGQSATNFSSLGRCLRRRTASRPSPRIHPRAPRSRHHGRAACGSLPATCHGRDDRLRHRVRLGTQLSARVVPDPGGRRRRAGRDRSAADSRRDPVLGSVGHARPCDHRARRPRRAAVLPGRHGPAPPRAVRRADCRRAGRLRVSGRLRLVALEADGAAAAQGRNAHRLAPPPAQHGPDRICAGRRPLPGRNGRQAAKAAGRAAPRRLDGVGDGRLETGRPGHPLRRAVVESLGHVGHVAPRAGHRAARSGAGASARRTAATARRDACCATT